MLPDLKGQFLIATTENTDPIMQNTVIYICDHDSQGAWGLVLNVATDMSVLELVNKLNFQMSSNRDYSKDCLVRWGGKDDSEQGFILHSKPLYPFEETTKIAENIMLSTSKDALQAIGTINSPDKVLVCLGCTIWSIEDLEDEITKNQWIFWKADPAIIFENDLSKIWLKAYSQIDSTGMILPAIYA